MYIERDISCQNVAPDEIANVFRRTLSVELLEFTIKGISDTLNQLHLPAHLLATHTSHSLDLSCSENQQMIDSNNIFQPRLTIDPDAFSSTRNVTTSLKIAFCDLSRLDFAFLNKFEKLQNLRISHSSNVGMADWGRLPPLPALEELFIEDDGITTPNKSWADNLPSLNFGISKLSLIGNGFSEDETADRILRWIYQSSGETLTHVELRNWKKLTRIPRQFAFCDVDSLSVTCGHYDNNDRTLLLDLIAFQSPSTTDEKDGFSSIEFLSIKDCDMNRSDFTFVLKGIKKLKEFKIHHSSNVNLMTDWGRLPLLPPMEKLFIEDENINPNKSWTYNLPPLKCGLSKLSLIGVGFSGDETADRILQWLHQSSAETLKHVELINWSNLTRIPRRLSSYKNFDRLEIICNNFEMPIIEENSIGFNVPFRLFALKHCGIKDIRPGAIQGRRIICFYFRSFNTKWHYIGNISTVMNGTNTNMLVLTNNSLTRLESSNFEKMINQIIKNSGLKALSAKKRRKSATTSLYPPVFIFNASQLQSIYFFLHCVGKETYLICFQFRSHRLHD